MNDLLARLHHTLIVSCQAEPGFPLNRPEYLAALAETVVIGGASAIRASEPVNIQAIRQAVEVPIIGIYKKDYPGFAVRITPTLAEVEAVVRAGSDIVALDATNRPRPDGHSLEDLFQAYKAQFDVPLMADISTLEEGIYAAQLGADLVATTLSGYTSGDQPQVGPNIQLIRELAAAIKVPIIAEGRMNSPEDVREALAAGAHAVVVGSMITRPHLITQKFVAATQLPSIAETVLALDIGGTKIAGGIVEGGSQLVLEHKIPTPTSAGGPAILESVIQLIEQLLERYNGPTPSAIGISSGGQIDATGQIVGESEMIPNWAGLPLKEKITIHFGLPTTVINDGHAATLAEMQVGAGRGQASLLCMVIGTGLGGGLAIDGHIQHGANGLAGSLGQMKVSPDGQSTVTFETVVSGPALIKAYNARVTTSEKVTTGQQVAERVRTGDQIAFDAIEEIGDWLGWGLAHALSLYDVSCIVIGGSVAQIGPPLFDSVRRSLQKHGYSHIANTPIVPAQLGPKAGLMGAALFARQQSFPR
jgi:putative N-acetylmannosamine-6-phosphate epimerase/predicted NBD/HSP70 family sugar kinase